MVKKQNRSVTDHLVPLYMNGMQGRMLKLPSSTKRSREILILYGIHSSIERMFGLADELSKYGSVTLPDLPGIGGMDSFYKINEKPSIDNMADYLAAFIKMHYKRRRFTIVGFSLGFVVAAKMLQKYPEISKKVDLLISIVGFAHKDEFKFTKINFLIAKASSRFFSMRLPAWFGQNFALRSPFIKAVYNLQADSHSKFKDADKQERDKRIKFEVELWKSNDLRTYMHLINRMLSLDICDKRVDLPVYHVAVGNDQYFNNHIVEQHFAVIFSKVEMIHIDLHAHMPTVVAEAHEVAPFVPRKLRRLLTSA